MWAKGISLNESTYTIMILGAVDKFDQTKILVLRKLHASGMRSMRNECMTIKYRS